MSIHPMNPKKYDRSFFLLLGLSLSLTAILTAFRWSSPEQINRFYVDHADQKEVFEFVELSRNREIEKEQVKRPKPNPQNTTTTTNSDPVSDPDPEPNPEHLTDPNLILGGGALPVDTTFEPELPFRIVEDMPLYPGGESALFADIGKNFKLPEIDKRSGFEGVIYLSFVVNASGEVVDVQILRGLSPATDAEAMRAIQKLKRFTPGKQRGRAVSVIYTVPIRVILR